ncbi:hypothetical protein [Pedobacter punctiformis]|uniref:Uncharacterized protein n=1 Tax=Pedobacter punctiformis TaxID=3004097 RepID=A0ABT4L8N8_9SPHI|nr:hypothetical protein [Pedobacter sp. HCMS5-2]MCZ4244288.1 hypothetical protein [Pedobacter sp. HCMS5-2]
MLLSCQFAFGQSENPFDIQKVEKTLTNTLKSENKEFFKNFIGDYKKATVASSTDLMLDYVGICFNTASRDKSKINRY